MGLLHEHLAFSLSATLEQLCHSLLGFPLILTPLPLPYLDKGCFQGTPCLHISRVQLFVLLLSHCLLTLSTILLLLTPQLTLNQLQLTFKLYVLAL